MQIDVFSINHSKNINRLILKCFLHSICYTHKYFTSQLVIKVLYCYYSDFSTNTVSVYAQLIQSECKLNFGTNVIKKFLLDQVSKPKSVDLNITRKPLVVKWHFSSLLFLGFLIKIVH